MLEATNRLSSPETAPPQATATQSTPTETPIYAGVHGSAQAVAIMDQNGPGRPVTTREVINASLWGAV